MIESIRFCVNHASRIRKVDLPGARLAFKAGYNALIGPNGSGKSTVLEAIASCSMCEVDKAPRDKVKYVTTETLNPLAGGAFSTRHAMIQGIRAMFRSHGQSVLDSFRNQWHAGETAVLIDSPETGQDMDNSDLMFDALWKMAEEYQVIVATNSLAFMRAGNLIDLGENSLRELVEKSRRLADGLAGRVETNR
jgi:predicted ATPase